MNGNDMQDNQVVSLGEDIEGSNATPLSQEKDFYIAGIGASAGGLEALQHFFDSVPADSGIAYVVIQHLSPDYKSLMPELISRHTKMKVFQIQSGQDILPNCVYVNPPNNYVALNNNQLQLTEQDTYRKVITSIDTFFVTLANDQREKAIGIILSGTGSDGTHGCRAIKATGGVVLAQDETAKFFSMPRSIIATRICDYVLPPDQMPAALLKYIGKGSFEDLCEDKALNPNDAVETLPQIYKALKEQFAVDFSLYKQGTVLRCIDRRMRINQISTLDDYLAYICENPKEAEFLHNGLLIGVTRFFRDADAFEIIWQRVIPEIFSKKTDNSVIRVWVAGCSTGEEVYSLAILFKEYMEVHRKNIPMKIFATDIDNDALQHASNGIYNDSITVDVSFERLNRYFIKKKDAYQVIKTIRDMVIFSYHNVISTPPFQKTDLLSCRNLLIYFKPELQKRILSIFQFSLDSNSFLFLGSSETTGQMTEHFTSVDTKWRIYRRKDTKKHPIMDDLGIITTTSHPIMNHTSANALSYRIRNSYETEEIYEKLIERCVPPSILIDENGEVVQICGDCDKYLKIPRSRAKYDILKIVPQELSTALGTAINKVRKGNMEVIYTNIGIHLDQEEELINLIVRPFPTRKNGLCTYIIFEEVKENNIKVDSNEKYDTIGTLQQRIVDLEQELQFTRESLQTSMEEFETSSEEFKSSNEELLVSNEELQSTNEELQSVNEELIILNSKYQYKMQELEDLNNDMTNFLNSTSIGTIFLDTDLYIRRFTPSITKVINVMDQDIGRPIVHISHNLMNEDLVKESMKVIDNLVSTEREILSSNGQWYIIRYSPYRTHENSIKGVVISLIDITLRKDVEVSLLRSKERYEKLVENSPFAIIVLKGDTISFSNREGLKLLGVTCADKLLGKPLTHYLHILSDPQLSDLHTVFEIDDNPEVKFSHGEILKPDGTIIHLEIMATTAFIDDENSRLIILRDISLNIEAEILRIDNHNKTKRLDEALAFDMLKNDFFSNLSHELRTPLNVIMSTLQLLETQIEDDEVKGQQRLFNIMKQNCYRQLRLVNNIIDMTKIDSGFFEINLLNHNIVQIVEDITLSVSEYIEQNHITLIFDTDVEEKSMACEPDKIERIMLNLLSNALKHTKEQGCIFVDIQDMGESIKIKVRDTGIGISEDNVGIIFDRFRQVDKSLTRHHEGSGIGLSLVKSLVEMHDGNISVRSEYGKGTEFIIELPVNQLLEENDIIPDKFQEIAQDKVEKIRLEFSDIYMLNR